MLGTRIFATHTIENNLPAICHPSQFRLVHPRLATQAWAGVAQLVERKALNLVVKGSSPFFGDGKFWAFFPHTMLANFVQQASHMGNVSSQSALSNL